LSQHRLLARRGKKKAAVAVVHSILVAIYHMIQGNVPYRELGADYLAKLNASHVKRHHIKRLESLGFKVTLEEVQDAA
jgi:hypothetical protein